MASSGLRKSVEFCRLFGALDDLGAVQRRFQEIAVHRPEHTVDKDSFLKLFAIAPDLADHVFRIFAYNTRNGINFNNFLLAFTVFTDNDNSRKVDLIRNLFCGGYDREVYRPEIIHIVDIVIDGACCMMGVDIYDPIYLMMVEQKAKDIAGTLIDSGRNDDWILLSDLYHQVQYGDMFHQLRAFVLETAVRASCLLRPYPKQSFRSSFNLSLRSDGNNSFLTAKDAGTSSTKSKFTFLQRFIFPEYCIHGLYDKILSCLDGTLTPEYRIDEQLSLGSLLGVGTGRKSGCHCDGTSEPCFDEGSCSGPYLTSIGMEGYVYKRTQILRRLKRRWIVIRNNMLYSFHNQFSSRPNIVLPLSGAVCDLIPDERYPCSFTMVGNRRHLPRFAFNLVSTICHITRTFYLHTAEQRDHWVDIIRIASRDFNLAEHYHISSIVHRSLPNVFECKGAHTGRDYILKYIDKFLLNDSDLDALRIESGILRFVDHPDIAESVALYEDKAKVYILRPYIPHWVRLDELIGARGTLSVNSVALIMRQVLSGLDFLHSHGLVLGAFGPANIIIQLNSLRKHRIQMVDIGLRKFFVPALDCETLSYVAPEVEEKSRFGPKSDMWSVGAIMYRLLIPRSTRLDISLAKRGVLDLSRTCASRDVISTLKRILNRNPSKRLRAADVLRANWIQDAVEGPFQLHFPKCYYMPQYLPKGIAAEAGALNVSVETGSRETLSEAGEFEETNM